MRLPTIRNSSFPKPLLVPAGVPSLIPEVTKGLSGSNGTPFLLQVIPAFSSDLSAALPVIFLVSNLQAQDGYLFHLKQLLSLFLTSLRIEF